MSWYHVWLCLGTINFFSPMLNYFNPKIDMPRFINGNAKYLQWPCSLCQVSSTVNLECQASSILMQNCLNAMVMSSTVNDFSPMSSTFNDDTNYQVSSTINILFEVSSTIYFAIQRTVNAYSYPYYTY